MHDDEVKFWENVWLDMYGGRKRSDLLTDGDKKRYVLMWARKGEHKVFLPQASSIKYEFLKTNTNYAKKIREKSFQEKNQEDSRESQDEVFSLRGQSV